MSTVEPHTPEPGWLRRWTVQSLQLAPRMGAAAVLMAVGVWIMGSVALLAESMLTVPFGDSRLVQDIARVVSTALGVPVLLGMVALFVQGDRGQKPDWAQVGALSVSGMRLLVVVGVFIQLFVLTIFGAWTNPARPFMDNLGLWGEGDVHHFVAAAAIGIDAMTSTLALLSFTGVLAVPFVVGMGADWAQAVLFHKRMRAKMPRVNSTLWWVLIGTAITAILMPPLVGFALVFFLALWLFVAAREIVGGIRSNGKEAATAPKAQAQPTV